MSETNDMNETHETTTPTNESVRTWTIVKIAMLPAILAVGFLYWLIFVQGVHDFKRVIAKDERQDAIIARHNEAVGAATLPKEPIKIEIRNNKRMCFHVDKVEIEEEKIYWYATNTCSEKLGYVIVRWKQLAPDGTVVGEVRWTNSQSWGLDAGQRGEFESWFELDPRAEKVVFAVEGI